MLLLTLFIASFVAFSISAVCGGGAGLVLIPILGFVLPVTQVPTALTIGTASSAFSRIWLFYEAIRWDIFKLFLPTALLGVLIGTWVLSYLDPVYLELCMSVFLVSNLTQLIGGSKSIAVQRAFSPWLLRLIGFLAGFISGLTGAVGVLFNRFYFRFGLSNQEIVATRAANEALLHLLKLYIYAYLGFLTMQSLQIGLVVALAALLSSRLMKVLLPKLSKALFVRFGYGAMVVAGVLMFNSALVQIKAAHHPDFRVQQLAKGLDASWSWDALIYSLEFKYAEGLEFEKVVPFSDLSADEQAFVYAQQALYAKVIIEKVYTLGTQSYEAYFYDEKNKLIKKVKFKPML
ncbi:sulfite exporter TauE/SafE family protein [Methylomonas methanica]|uniref:Probable membrane transporter protein n=1 Tax=Methylomonas methanica (strain DSM 25384 / MC09) TaxID=857087 RepID=G0A5Y1_METMM|nr:sulfite exporter TauE/SafE family protein [Methylomonas methanica]AEF99258.1 protein of unknown function DUF81 [Methylomonas methanica MC09]